ncbi:hypothetical protein ETR_06040 [Erwinia tracheiphila PSU-1]|nr:hypothetical protein ETR_06040 [Erwinia tracheiphila PSU-1]
MHQVVPDQRQRGGQKKPRGKPAVSDFLPPVQPRGVDRFFIPPSGQPTCPQRPPAPTQQPAFYHAEATGEGNLPRFAGATFNSSVGEAGSIICQDLTGMKKRHFTPLLNEVAEK